MLRNSSIRLIYAARRSRILIHDHRHSLQTCRLSSSLKQERKRRNEELHNELVQMQKKMKEVKKIKIARSLAAKALPQFFRIDNDCFNATMSELELETDTSYPYIETKGDGILSNSGSKQKLYKDSLQPFCKMLEDEPASVMENAEELLDELVKAGFSDGVFTKRLIKMKKKDVNMKIVKSHINAKMRSIKRVNKRIDRFNSMLDKIKETSHDLIKSIKAKEEEIEEPNLFSSISDSIKQFFQSPNNEPSSYYYLDATTNDNDDDDGSSPSSRLSKKMKRKTRRLNNSLSSSLRDRKSLVKQLESLRQNLTNMESLSSSDPPLIAATGTDETEAMEVLTKVSMAFAPALASYIQKRHEEMFENYRSLVAKTDLTKPHEWYMHARLDRRTIIYHGGPTNSGKTYQAIQRLKEASNGLYLGPLRLLAAEVYDTMTQQGVYTNLYTGQVKEEIPFSTHTAATIETAPLDRDFDVVVIDEIQMIADPHRGFAWTRALHGLRCKEIHLCGGLEALTIVKKIVDDCGDDFVLKTYERFSKLTVAETHLKHGDSPGCYRNVLPGDCIVAFSRNDIFAIKREIETLTPYRCCVIYGTLPPRTRTDQAQKFNDPNSGYDILVASDAIGMGLNLNIKRIIFNSILKNNGEGIVRLDHSSVKQISGRAGRRNSPFPEGEVTCRDPVDYDYLVECMGKEIAQIGEAGLLPTASHITTFHEAMEECGEKLSSSSSSSLLIEGEQHGSAAANPDLHLILSQFSEMATLQGDFFLCRQKSMVTIARWLKDIPLSIEDKYTFCMAPVNTDNHRMMTTLQKFAYKYARNEASGVSYDMIPKQPKTFEDLSWLCSLHNNLELYLWLSNKFPGNLIEMQSALMRKEQTIQMINDALANTDQLELNHCYIERDMNLRMMCMRDNHGFADESADLLSIRDFCDR